MSPRHGLLATPDDGPPAPTRAERLAWEHIAEVRAAMTAVGPGSVGTHDSAAVVLGLSRPSIAAPSRVTLVRPGVPDFDGPGLRVRGSEIPSAFVVLVDDIPVTDLRRTAVDLARSRSLPEALVPVDAAARALVARWSGALGNDLRRAVRDPELRRRARSELGYAASACRGWRGIASARRAIAVLDPASESPLESRSRGWFLEAGILGLELGTPISIGARTLWADFCAPTHRLIGEADGWSKYGDDLAQVRRSLAAEKDRQAALESAGWRVVRWTGDDTRQSVVARMAAALRRD